MGQGNEMEREATAFAPTSDAAFQTDNTIAVIILNWNAAEDTLRAAQAVAGWRRSRPQLFLVDNASHDGSVAALRQALPAVHLLINTQNLGFSGGTNQGIAAALAADSVSSDRPILLLNNDARIDEDELAQLMATLSGAPEIGIVGPVLYHDAPPYRVLSAGNRDPVLHHHTLITEPPGAGQIVDVDYISGSVALIRSELLRAVGLLDEDYFFNMEVADLCRRARMQGWRCVVDGRARAYHNLERSSALRSTLYTYYLIRNRFLYIRKFYRMGRLPLSGLWALYSLLLAGKLRLQGNGATARAVWLGLTDGLRGRWGGQNARVLAACHPAHGP
jgi:GT2 family glycosyltransferase